MRVGGSGMIWHLGWVLLGCFLGDSFIIQQLLICCWGRDTRCVSAGVTRHCGCVSGRHAVQRMLCCVEGSLSSRCVHSTVAMFCGQRVQAISFHITNLPHCNNISCVSAFLFLDCIQLPHTIYAILLTKPSLSQQGLACIEALGLQSDATNPGLSRSPFLLDNPHLPPAACNSPSPAGAGPHPSLGTAICRHQPRPARMHRAARLPPRRALPAAAKPGGCRRSSCQKRSCRECGPLWCLWGRGLCRGAGGGARGGGRRRVFGCADRHFRYRGGLNGRALVAAGCRWHFLKWEKGQTRRRT